MRAQQAAAQVNATKFKPGWKPYASVLDDRRIIVGFEVTTVDTSYRDADGEFTREITMRPSRTLDVSRFTDLMLDYMVLKLADELDEHENREFLARRQPDGKWSAPLHPHTQDGELAWLILSEADRDRVLV